MNVNANQAKLDDISYLYWKRRDQAFNMTTEDILSEDVTPFFWRGLQIMVLQKHLITLSVRGNVTSGKSTIALKIKKQINEWIYQSRQRKDKVDEYETICSDQIEFNRAIMKGHENLCYMIDEWSELGSTGENATTEQSLFQFYTEVAAQRFLHRVTCSPSTTNIYNRSNLFLDVIGRDDSKKTTTCVLKYCDSSDINIIPLGLVIIEVGDILETEAYQRYRRKKFARISLLDKHGVRDVRELESSMITMKIFNELKPLATMTTKIAPEIIDMTIKQVLKEDKLFFSIVGRALQRQPIAGLLSAQHELEKYKRKLLKPLQETEKAEIEKMRDIIETKLNSLIEKENENVRLLEDYYSIQ